MSMNGTVYSHSLPLPKQVFVILCVCVSCGFESMTSIHAAPSICLVAVFDCGYPPPSLGCACVSAS